MRTVCCLQNQNQSKLFFVIFQKILFKTEWVNKSIPQASFSHAFDIQLSMYPKKLKWHTGHYSTVQYRTGTQSLIGRTTNGMVHHSLGGAVIFISLQPFILPYLTYCPACKPKARGFAIRAVRQVGENKVLLRNKFCLKTYKFCLKI